MNISEDFSLHNVCARIMAIVVSSGAGALSLLACAPFDPSRDARIGIDLQPNPLQEKEILHDFLLFILMHVPGFHSFLESNIPLVKTI